MVLAPPGTVGGAAVRGGAPGSREVDALSHTGTVQECHAVVLTGGSAFGLATADGVMAWCEAQGIGFALPTVTVPIVAAAVCFDIRSREQRRPDREAGLGRLRGGREPTTRRRARWGWARAARPASWPGGSGPARVARAGR